MKLCTDEHLVLQAEINEWRTPETSGKVKRFQDVYISTSVILKSYFL